jgi:hypothetical protein
LQPPDGFAVRAAIRAAARFRRVRRAKWASGLAAVLALGATGGWAVFAHHAPPPPPVPIATPAAELQLSPPTTPKLGESFAEAGEALASLSRSTADKAVGPTRSLVASTEAFRLPAPKAVTPVVDPAAQSLAAVPSAAKASLEPLASNTRRAFALFLRDTGLQAPN